MKLKLIKGKNDYDEREFIRAHEKYVNKINMIMQKEIKLKSSVAD